MRNKNVLPIIFTAKQIFFLCLQHVENKGFQTVIKHRLKAIQKPIKNELGNREKNTENAHFVLKKCTFRFRDYRRIENQQKKKNPAFTAQIKRDFQYFPVVEAFRENGKTHYRPSKDVVCVDETIPTYYFACYHDRSNFKKEDNPYMYNGVKEVLGQEFADDMVRRYKANKWTISYSYTGGGLNDKIDYAIKESDDGKFFLLKTISPYGGSINACYFKDGKPYICKKDDDGTITGKELQ